VNDKTTDPKSRGGVSRASRLSPEERSAIARLGAQRRWNDRRNADQRQELPRALPGFSAVLDIAGVKLPCAVITGPKGIQRVLSETGITNAILGSRSGASKRLKQAASRRGEELPLFLAPTQLQPFVPLELMEGPLVPIDYLDGDRVIRAYDAAVLPGVCKVWLDARREGALQNQQEAKAAAAEVLMSGLAHTGIVALIDEATGYEKIRPQNALQAYIDKVIGKELAAWAKKFPDEFYENIYRLKAWPWPGMKKNRYSVVAHYTRDLVYDRLGPGILRELERKEPKDVDGQREHRFHQWLTPDVGDPMLTQHLISLLTLQRLALANGHGWRRFIQTVDQVYPRYGATMVLALDVEGDASGD
jgi:hypothetical protein